MFVQLQQELSLLLEKLEYLQVLDAVERPTVLAYLLDECVKGLARLNGHDLVVALQNLEQLLEQGTVVLGRNEFSLEDLQDGQLALVNFIGNL